MLLSLAAYRPRGLAPSLPKMEYRRRLNPFAALLASVLTFGLVTPVFADSGSQVLLGKGNEHGEPHLTNAPPPSPRELRGKFLHITGMSLLYAHLDHAPL